MQVKQLSGPPGSKDAASLVAQQVGSGLVVCTLSNLDASRMRVVRRGSVVEFPGGARARVLRVRLGNFYPDVCPGRATACGFVRVVA